MALTLNGTQNNAPAIQLPADYDRPTVPGVSNPDWSDTRVLTVAKSTVENADDNTTIDAIVAAVNTQVQAVINDNFDVTSNAVTVTANIINIANNLNLQGVLYTNGALNYVCTVQIFAAIS
jgi:hypothetical protein